MGEKRKRSSTLSRAPAAKRQSITPAPQPTSPPPAPDVPTSFARDGPLPVLPACQPDNLVLKDYRSVAESKVLAESLVRSQRKWVDGDIFEKFWTKPLKARKLDPAILEKNPGKDCMVKLGNATMHIVPHKFDIRLYQVLRPVKEAPPPPPPPTPPQQTPVMVPQQQQPVQGIPAQQQPPAQVVLPLGVPQAQPNIAPLAPMMGQQSSHPVVVSGPPLVQAFHAQAQVDVPVRQPQPQKPQQPQQPQQPFLLGPVQVVPQQPASAPTPPPQVPQRVPPSQAVPRHPPQTVQPALQPPQPIQNIAPPPRPPPPQPQPQIIQQQSPRPPQQRLPQQGQHLMPPHPQVVPPRPDPVIQMLAMKAATDVKLKELMRIVASGKANRDQLQEFQGYIDMLTAASNNPPLLPPSAQFRQGPPLPPPPQQMQQTPRQQMPPPHQVHPQPHMQGPIQMHHMQSQQMYQQPVRQPQPVQRPPPQPKKAFPQAPKQEICGIVFEFIDSYSQGDRFLFPRFTILEYLNRGTTVKASFIVTRKPPGLEEEYYEPVTITLECAYPRILDHLRMVVADPDATRAHMKQIMANLNRVNPTFLAYRLRREPGEAVPHKTYIETRMEPPTAARSRAAAARDNSSTPMRETKGSGNALSGPKVKHVKKHTASSLKPTTTANSATTTTTASAITPTTSTTTIATPAAVTVTMASPALATRSPPPPPPPTPPPPPPPPLKPKLPKPPRSRKGRIADPTKNCHICRTSKTSLWRKADIEGENVTVCNACGIKWKTSAQKQVQIAAAVAQGLPIPTWPVDEGEVGVMAIGESITLKRVSEAPDGAADG